MAFPDETLVDVRADPALAWRPGQVGSQDDACWFVDLDTPYPTADEWSGVTRNYGGSEPVTKTAIWKQTEKLTPGDFIRERT